MQIGEDYLVLFEDTSYPDGYSPPLSVAQRYVIMCKEDKKKWNYIIASCNLVWPFGAFFWGHFPLLRFLQCTSHGVKIGWGLRINIICENARIVQFHVLVENVSIYETVAEHWWRVLYTPCGVEPVNLWCMYVSVVMRWVLALAKTSGRSNSWHKGLHCPRTRII